MASTYEELSCLPMWRRFVWFDGFRKSALSVHVPLQWPGSSRFAYMDCALNAYYLEMPLDMNTSSEEDRKHCASLRTRLLSFAFGKAGAVPDFRQVRLSRQFGGKPMICAEFNAWHLVHQLEYFVDVHGCFRIRVSVRNESARRQECVVWVRPSEPLESQVFDYHYHSFEWDASRWVADDAFSFEEDSFLCNGERVGLVRHDASLELQWHSRADFRKVDSKSLFTWEAPYIVQPRCQLGLVKNVLSLSGELEPGETCSFELVFSAEPLGEMKLAGHSQAESEALVKWNSYLEGKAEVDFGDSRDNAVFEAVRLCNLQLLLNHGDSYQPCQGGSSERFFVWVWEAMCSLRPMIDLGHFDEVRRALEFIFSLQDAGCPPSGEFTTVAGAVGTSGPKWANTTGAALILASTLLRHCDDSALRERFLPKMRRAAQWIVGEVQATRRQGVLNYGIMPPACASDGDFGQLVFTDCWLLGGLLAFGSLLEYLGEADSGMILGAASHYRTDLSNVLARVTGESGFISRSFGDDAHVCNEFRFTDTCLDCCAAGVFDGKEPRMSRYLDWLERHAFVGLFCSEVSRGIYYIGNNELTIMKMYLDQGRYGKAWLAAQVFRRYGMTQDLYLTQERYSANDVGFTAWQPNASNNGRYLELENHRIWHEKTGAIVLFGGYEKAELAGKQLQVRELRTCFGKTTIRLDNYELSLETELPISSEIKFITPWTKWRLDRQANQCTHSIVS